VGRDLAIASPLLAGSKVVAQVAMLNSYGSRWSTQWQPHHRDFDYVRHFMHYYGLFAARNIPVDIISADAPLDGYRLVIAPALLILNESRIRHLREFVKDGGHLVLTIRCGRKDQHNALLPSRQPGPLADLAGVEVTVSRSSRKLPRVIEHQSPSNLLVSHFCCKIDPTKSDLPSSQPVPGGGTTNDRKLCSEP
jgi:beta-galactosidase GanA